MTRDVQVVAGTVSAKTDRLEGIVDFTEQQVTESLPTAKPTGRQKSQTILADSLAMQSVSRQFKFLRESVRVH